MNTASRALIEQTADYIECSIKDQLSLDAMSAELGLSKYHLHRFFKGVTGLPLMYYARGRKLTASLFELLQTDLNMIDIACEYGFEYEQTYERAFKRQFGVSPAAFRRTRSELAVIHRLDTSLLLDVSQGVLTQPTYVLRPECTLSGVQTFVVHEENWQTLSANKLGRDFFGNQTKDIEGVVNPLVYYGLCSYSDNTQYGDFYMPSVEVEKPFAAPPPLLCRTLPMGYYAVFRYVGLHAPEELTIRCLLDIYNYIDNVWRVHTQKVQSHPFHFERMDMSRCSPTYCEADIFVPVEG